MVRMNTRGKLTPGKPTPIRTVPDSIERPEYAWKDEVQENIGCLLYTSDAADE